MSAGVESFAKGSRLRQLLLVQILGHFYMENGPQKAKLKSGGGFRRGPVNNL
jgi:hypothetical protein